MNAVRATKDFFYLTVFIRINTLAISGIVNRKLRDIIVVNIDKLKP